MGAGTLRVPMSMHAEHRVKFCEALRTRLQGVNDVTEDAVVFLQGGSEISVYDTDTTWDFRQESNFNYLFGVKEPDCLAILRIRDASSVLLVPRLAKEYAKWLGPIKPLAWFSQAYGVDQVFHADEVAQALSFLGATQIMFLQGDTNRDSGLRLPRPSVGDVGIGISDAASQIAWDTINECRLIKSQEELKVLQFVNDVSSEAHLEVMRSTRGGQRERMAEVTFRYQASLRGCFRTGYSCICPSGRRNAILHYGHAAEPNSELVETDDLRLHDMGAEYHGYSADVTTTFPTSGRFNAAQRTVYEAVWAAVLVIERQIRPGVSYKKMHRLAHQTLLERMTDGGLFVGDIEAMMAVNLMSHFMPHGLGHSLGLDVHDVGGYPPGEFLKDDPSITENLRLGRELKEGMVITVEPGFYFIDYLIEEALASPEKAAFINKERLFELWAEVGGVRIEDDVLITSSGCRVLTCLPRTPEEIEAVMSGQPWTVSAGLQREYVAGAIGNDGGRKTGGYA
eukprot:TRINITY_DN17908_c0_g1_i1.p1 TRINITY_DN17908_c0_g1~~TRINITY_DN17908_c0_g1_i1.p1  ORF type:complete len:581 (+),score=75.68 TRINITY_DN17908_c0_g1_i1:216-1745(+)